MMDLKKIMSIAGYPGLYKLVTQGKNNIIVESLIDQKRMPAFSSHKISALEDIAVFTEEKEVPLKDVLKSIYDKELGKECIDPKSEPEKLKDYFAAVLPAYDREKVYASDIKKMLSWYNLLLKNKILDFTEEEKPEESAENNEASATDDKPVAKTPKSTANKPAKAKPQGSHAPKGNVKAKGKTTSFASKKGGE
jgi:hypothetical protein